jgi:hypothetical protein
MDRLIGQFLTDFPQATLILCTALSQQPWTETTKCTFRPLDFTGLLKFAGVSAGDVEVKPVMAEEFHLTFVTAERAKAAKEKLDSLSIDGRRLLRGEINGASLFCACAINDPLAMRSDVVGSGGATVPFNQMFNMVHSMRSGRHHPDGVLWIRDGRHRVHDGKVRLVDIAPTVLDRFGVTPPSSMSGESLDRQMAEKAAPAIA